MTMPNYMETFQRAVRLQQERAGRVAGQRVESELSEKSSDAFELNSLYSLISPLPAVFGDAFTALEARCPDYVDRGRWQQAVADARRFLPKWGSQAEALGWTVGNLFGLHEPPLTPHQTYQRLSRRDCTGLIWLLDGAPVVALTGSTAAMQNSTGSIVVYRRQTSFAGHRGSFKPSQEKRDERASR